ncbi:phosphonate utilization transcriptional regulator PhnR [Vibrio rumoiensis]|uniref:Phosphonate utilization transcriptional regulator PhnR n=1 Tax=Vibrio rumoiensis 1S-45 TaxID=1188252 RepID=A0A1E5DZN5_9VIBR|nr:phosphonate utilization transcriptional regulator PhnR [Vibrio rumoiensis]OEF23493.1 phosphonate utilization transcriptional regulator PhnR [Vibrio rumoiensis 1S-45]
MQYVKIKDAIVEQIDSGMLTPRQKLPSERKLAESFDTTRVTLREALSLLEAEGKIYREDRRGWFISPEPLVYDPTQALNFTNMALIQNRVPETQLISAKSMLANKQAATLLNLAPFADVYRFDRVRYLDGRPVVFVTNFVRPDIFPKLLSHDLSLSLTELYREHYGQVYQRIRYRVSTTSLLGNIAQSLRAATGSPATLVERVNFNNKGELISCDLEYWRHDAMCIESVAELTTENC